MVFRVLCLLMLMITGAACVPNGAIITRDDPFQGATRSFARYLDIGHYTAVGMIDTPEGAAVQVLVVLNGQSNEIVSPGDVGEFKLGSRTIKLRASKESRPVTNATRYSVFSQWLVNFQPTPDELREFARKDLRAVKVNVGGLTLQLALSPEDIEVIRKNAEAFLPAAG